MFLLVALAMWIFGIGGYLPNGEADEPAGAIYLKIGRIFFKSASPPGPWCAFRFLVSQDAASYRARGRLAHRC